MLQYIGIEDVGGQVGVRPDLIVQIVDRNADGPTFYSPGFLLIDRFTWVGLRREHRAAHITIADPCNEFGISPANVHGSHDGFHFVLLIAASDQQ